MNQRTLLNKIEEYLATFQLQVKISSKNNLYDINVHSETVMIPILNILFGTNLSNENDKVKNADSIDLLDTNKRIAFQITASYKLEKIKTTLTKLMASSYRSKFDKLYVYVLTEKQKSYSQPPLTKIVGKKMNFEARTDIIDATNLFGLVKGINNINVLKEVHELLRKQFSELYLSETFTKNDYLKFREKYKKSCITNFYRLNFFGLSVSKKPREVDLYELFVLPRFNGSNHHIFTEQTSNNKYLLRDLDIKNIRISAHDVGHIMPIPSVSKINLYKNIIFKHKMPNTFSESIDFANIFSLNKHLVILGNPGAGKSSIVKYSICKILENDTPVFLDKTVYETLPIRIELHKYNQVKKEKKVGFLEYMTIMLAEENQTNIMLDDLHHIFLHFPTIVFFDGLDEIFDVTERLLVRNDIENIIGKYQQLRAVVTSRFESYTEVKLSTKLFENIDVRNFDDNQVKDYVGKWYKLEEENEKVRKDEIQNCLKQLEHVDPELKFNPLLLSLILILYRNELEIPTSKLEIYESCTNTILDHRDTKEKKLSFGLKITNPIAVFSALAYWQFDIDLKQSTLNFAEVSKFVKMHLLKKGEFSDDHVAQQAAGQFIEFAKVRSLYFENKFTHKTFLEYFTSYYLYSNIFSKPHNYPQLEEIFNKNIGLSSWAVVLELLICKIDSTQSDFEIIDSIIEKQVANNSKMAISFFLNVVKYIKNVSPNCIGNLIREGILFCIDPKRNHTKKDMKYVEIVFSNLVSLIKLPRFQEQFSLVFKEIIEAQKAHLEDLVIFANEFFIASASDILLNILKDKKAAVNSPYIFLLLNYPKLKDDTSFLQLISEIIADGNDNEFFGKVFKSPFGQKIFFGSEQFSYLTSFILTREPSKLLNSYQLLREKGVSYNAIKVSVGEKSAIFNYDSSFIHIDEKNPYHKEFIKIRNILEETYFPSTNTKKTNEKFYDRFFQKYPRK